MERQISFVVPTLLWTGGAEIAMGRLARELVKNDYRVRILAFGRSSRSNPWWNQFRDLESIVEESPDFNSWIANLNFLRLKLTQDKGQIVHSWLYKANLLSGLVKPKTMSLVWSIRHSLDDLSNESIITKLGLLGSKVLSRRVDSILFNSQRSLKQHECFGIKSKKDLFIPNGFELRNLSTKRESGLSSFTIGHLGRFHPVKAQMEFIEALGHLKQHDFQVLMGGRNITPSNGKLMKLIQDSGLVNRITLAGELQNPTEFFSSLDLFCLNSHSEGFPNVVGEAMAQGLPCVVTDVGDAAYLVGDSGQVVLPRNTPSLAKAIEKMILMPAAQRLELGQKARKRIEENFSIERMVEAHMDLYEKLLD